MAVRLGELLRDERHPLSEAERRALVAVLARETGGIRNVNELVAEDFTTGQRAADLVARHMGSWRFILIQASVLLVWLVVNSLAWLHHWDPYPFILLNLVLSFQAAFAAPVILMSQNRQAVRDRLDAEQDYTVDRRAELEVVAIHARLDELAGRQWDGLVALQREQLQLLGRIEEVAREVHRATARP
jgi:uncharacterized membrane protein